jgi:hypothetical protein
MIEAVYLCVECFNDPLDTLDFDLSGEVATTQHSIIFKPVYSALFAKTVLTSPQIELQRL